LPRQATAPIANPAFDIAAGAAMPDQRHIDEVFASEFLRKANAQDASERRHVGRCDFDVRSPAGSSRVSGANYMHR
jgi:hypothetical protein